MNNQPLPSPKRVRFVELNAKALRALADGDLPAADAEAGVALDEHFISDRARWIFGYRADQLLREPSAAPWITRAVVSEPDGTVVGDAGFHGPPDAAGMIEVGYTVVPRFRRRGYARAMLTALLQRAAAEPCVTTVRARIGSDNAASLATIAGFGFTRVGEQGNESDGLTIVFEVPADAIPTGHPRPPRRGVTRPARHRGQLFGLAESGLPTGSSIRRRDGIRR